MQSKQNLALSVFMRTFCMSFLLFFFTFLFSLNTEDLVNGSSFAFAEEPVIEQNTVSVQEQENVAEQKSAQQPSQQAGQANSIQNLPITPTSPINTVNEVLPPLTVQAKQDTTYLAPYMSYVYNINARDPQDVFNARETFKPYSPLNVNLKLGTYWFLVHFTAVKDKHVAASYLDVGNFLPKDARILILPKHATRWQVLDDVYTREKLGVADSTLKEKDDQNSKQNNPLDALKNDLEEHTNISIFSNGLYDLTGLRDGGELLIYSPGMPSVWFSPSLVLPAKAPLSLDRRIAPFVLISLLLLMIFSLWRGLREEGDARLWATLLTFFALIQYVWGVPENNGAYLTTWNMIGVISASCALFLLPHIGRHYMITEKHAPSLDAFLQFLALPAVFPIAIMFVPLPEYLFIIHFAPLWGLYAFVPLVFCLPAMLRRKKGSLFYVVFCLCIATGALLGFHFRYNPVWHIAPQVGLVLAMSIMFLAPRQNEKNVIEKDPVNEDSVADLLENSIPMREAFFRVEAKLREPFDKIIREVCFLDFDTKAEDFTYSIDLLKEKEAYDKFDKNDINAIDDLVRRAQRLQKHTSSLVSACRDMSGMMGLMPQLAKKVPPFQAVHELFNLKNLVLQTFDLIRDEAQNKQIGLGWYIAPQMGLFYRGDKETLYSVIELLLKDAVRATEKGMISLRVRRANSPNPGHIVFTISDSGKGRPPIERSPLTLIKAWELATNYNGEVQLNSSPTGLSFSFSMECIAMDAQGMKALSFASLDDIVLSNHEKKVLKNTLDFAPEENKIQFSNELVTQTKTVTAESGGNIVFSQEEHVLEKNENNALKPEQVSEQTASLSSKEWIQKNADQQSVLSHSEVSQEESRIKKGTENETEIAAKKLTDANAERGINQEIHTNHVSESEYLIDTQLSAELDTYSQYSVKNRVSILLISPLAIQRQNFAWYLNQYELWEALDVDSALAFYEKKPAILVIVHSALSANDCNEVLAGIRLLEDRLGISPAPFLGLYQSAKDMESLKIAGCKHLLPATIGREELCTVVAEIMDNPLLDPIADIHAPHLVLKKEEKELKKQEDTKQKAKIAVEKRLNMKRVNAGQVIDGALDNDDLPFSSQLEEFPKTLSHTTMGEENNIVQDNGIHNQEISTDLTEGTTVKKQDSSLPYFQSDERIVQNQNKTNQHDISDHDSAHVTGGKVSQSDSFQLPESGHAYAEQSGIVSKLLQIIRPKPNKSIQTDNLIIDDYVGEAMPISKSMNDREIEGKSLHKPVALDVIKDKSIENFDDTRHVAPDSVTSLIFEDNVVERDVIERDVIEKNLEIKSQQKLSQDSLAAEIVLETVSEVLPEQEEQADQEQVEQIEQAEQEEQAEQAEQEQEEQAEQAESDQVEAEQEQAEVEQKQELYSLDPLALSFLPTEEQQYQAIDEDVPLLGSLSLSTNILELSETYAEIEKQSTFVHSGLLDNKNILQLNTVEMEAKLPDLKIELPNESALSRHVASQTQQLATDVTLEGTADTANVTRETVEAITDVNPEATQAAKEDEIIELTSSMLVPGRNINPDKIPSELRAQISQDALLNLDLEMPDQNRKKRKNNKKSKQSEKNTNLEVISLEIDVEVSEVQNKHVSNALDMDLNPVDTSIVAKEEKAMGTKDNHMHLTINLDEREELSSSEADSIKKIAQKPKLEQLSFFPTDPKH